jgi:hypothetical protein
MAIPIDHVNDRREMIAGVDSYEVRRKRRITFEVRAKRLATLDFVEEVKERTLAEGV